ncbi:MAG: ATP-binding protein [Rubrivivax sp.]
MERLHDRPGSAPGADPGPDTGPRWSLRARLLGLVLLVTAAAWVMGGIVTVRAARDVSTRMRDERLVQLGATVLVFARHELAEAAPGKPDNEADADHRAGLDLRYRYQVTRARHVLMSSPDAPTEQPLAGRWSPGFSTGRLDGRDARAYVSTPDESGMQVQLAELLDPDDESLPLPGWPVLALMALSLGLVGALAVALLMRVLRPVAVVEAALRARPLQSLEPLPTRGLPDEMRPLLLTLNDHLVRAAERLSRESGFTALAAHELRTPLAALRMQAQVALRAPDAARRDAQLRALLATVDRCDHLIGQLLTLARLEQEAGARAPVDLRALVATVLDELEGQHPGRAQAIEVDGPPAMVDGWAFALGVLLRNLLDNALTHAGASAEVRVQLAAHAGGVELCVDDAGPGIAPEARARAGERFVRLGGATGGRGVGLGLSIVRAVAAAHGADVELLDSPLGGLRVRVRFAAPAAAAATDEGVTADPGGIPARAP